AQKIAGCWKAVLCSTRRNGSSPTSLMQRSSSAGSCASTAARMSAVWLPWPGKRIAVAIALTVTPTGWLGNAASGSHPPGGGRALPGLEDRCPEPPDPHRPGDVAGRPVLGDESGRPRRPRGAGRDPAGAGDEQDVGRRLLLAQALADLRARLLAHEQVDECDV